MNRQHERARRKAAAPKQLHGRFAKSPAVMPPDPRDGSQLIVCVCTPTRGTPHECVRDDHDCD